jgi:diguanylate cyclase (GGDEF)-like protein/PAS domain S-box-containing protein
MNGPSRKDPELIKEIPRLNQRIRELEQSEADLIKAQKALQESETQYKALIDGMNDTVWVIDFDANVIDVNKAAVASLGYSKEELLAIGLFGLDSSLKKDDIKTLAHTMPADKLQVFETTHTTKDGRKIPVEVCSSLVTYHGKRAILSIARNITERKRVEEALQESEQRYREMSIVDDLTRLYNSRQFHIQLKIETDRSNRYEQPLVLLFLDLDDFKAFNDTYGHVEGDQILVRLGQVLKRCLRETDFAYRYGGEEFTVLLPMTTSTDGADIAERIRTEFKKETFSPAPGLEVQKTISIGLAQYRPQEEMKAFVHRADQIMYRAKKNGKDRICCES